MTNLLLSNDDGIHAPGIHALYEAIHDLGDLQVVAPDTERSAVGHAITISDPLKTQKIYKHDIFFGSAVSGTPADCIKLATTTLLKPAPDFVISGINLGPNAGISVLYSGTVSAATEGTILGFPSMALSLDAFTNPQWDTAARCARHVIQQFMKHPPPPDCLINVNIPNVPYDQIQGYKVTRTGRSRFREVFHPRQDPRGRTYYWLDGELEKLDDQKAYQDNTDLNALENNYVSITPLALDHTAYDCMQEAKSVYNISH